jgi:hypothetical protein
MNLSMKNILLVISFISMVIVLHPALAAADNWTYTDNFGTTAVEKDSFAHSIFWPEGAYPPQSEAFLYYSAIGQVGFAGYGENRLANLTYRFQIEQGQAQRAVTGDIQIDIIDTSKSKTSPGYLACSFSSDGFNWSDIQVLGEGADQNILLESVTGICYIRLEGKDVLVDNLEVDLSAIPATMIVPVQFLTIQQAIEAANEGDIIEVKPGTYKGAGFYNIDFKGKAITVRSQAGPNSTIIDCDSRGRGFVFKLGEKQDSVLCGFTIINASVRDIGGGIYCQSSSPSIIDCRIKNCLAKTGGGFGADSGDPILIDCIIEDCIANGLGTAGCGGGIALTNDSNALIVNTSIKNNQSYNNGLGAGIFSLQSGFSLTNCIISQNTAYGNSFGGGIYCGQSFKQINLTNCLIVKNTALWGGGIKTDLVSDMRVTNCTIADNKLLESQILTAGGIDSTGSSIVIENSIIWYNGKLSVSPDSSPNTIIRYSDIEGNYHGPGQENINVDPQFVSRESGNYHLKSILGSYDSNTGSWQTFINPPEHSPCIDAGDPQDLVGDEPVPNNNRINMGAYGGTFQASKSTGPLVLHVDGASGNDLIDGLDKGWSRPDAFKTIQAAVNWAEEGDIILVWPGTYIEEINLSGKNITIQSADEAAVIKAPTVSPRGYAFSFYNAEGPNCILRNLIITNCSEGAIFCEGASPSLINLTIVGNYAGVHAESGSDPIITNCILWNNQTADLWVDYFNPRISYSCIEHKLATVDMDPKKNISSDPRFANSAQGDYHLKSQYGRWDSAIKVWRYDNITSPCIDKGDYSSVGREQKLNGNRINMGAEGGTIFASKSSS